MFEYEDVKACEAVKALFAYEAVKAYDAEVALSAYEAVPNNDPVIPFVTPNEPVTLTALVPAPA